MSHDKPQRQRVPKASRPHMPGYGLPSGSKGLLSWKWAHQRLTRSHNYWLATTKPDGSPHVMPVWGIWVGSAFYFSTGRESRKARNLRANPRCIVCTEKSHESVILEGTAEEVKDSATLKKLAGPYARKYTPWKLDPSLGPIYAVRPSRIFGLNEKDGMKSATRWRFGS